MAVKAPAAPTPPTPPSVPGVKLENGGTAQETNVPHDKQQTHDERLEDQARQSVARGDGALAKTTQTKPEKEAKPQKPVDASGGASQSGQTVIVPAQNGLQQENPQQQALADAKAHTEQSDVSDQTAQDSWGQFASHGAVFWGAVLLFMAVLVWFGIRKLMGRKDGRKGALSFADIDGAAAPVSLPKNAGRASKAAKPAKQQRSREAVETFADLRGLTPDEVLAKLARDEAQALQAEMLQARAEAKERLQKAGRIPVNPNPPPQAARQYLEQVTADIPAEKAKPLQPVRKPKDKQEEARFEVRI